LQRNTDNKKKKGDYVIKEFLTNPVFLSVMIAAVICEVWKFIDGSVRAKKISWSALFDTGGMPSSHANFVCAIATAVGLVEGFTSSIFFVSAGLAVIVVRDAFGVRRDVDKMAKTINDIIKEKKIGIQQILKITGHSPVQVVAGTLLGIIVPLALILFVW
jgi:acid phosphatase family membrane protein YuiD